MRWLVTGSAGLLGTDLVALLAELGERVTAPARDDLDLLDPAAVSAAVAGHDVVVNCAAWTHVDGAEDHPQQAHAANGLIPEVLATAVAGTSARLVQMSTDYVFDGQGTEPYPEEAATAPRSVYGRSKEAGERAVRRVLPEQHLVVRTAWLYGAHGRCFPRTLATLLRKEGTASVVADQTGQPTWTRDVATVVTGLVRSGAPSGTYHATSSGQATWLDFARAVAESLGHDPATVLPRFGPSPSRAAARPSYSVLGHANLLRVGVAPIGPWRARWEQAASAVLAGL